MARLDQTIDVNELPEDEFSLLKEGIYTALIAEASIEANKNGTGKLIKLRLNILGPTNKGAVLFARINYIHQNPDAQRIGQVQLRQLMEASNLLILRDTDELINKVVDIKVGIQPAKDGYEASNVVKKFIQNNNISASSRPQEAVGTVPYEAPQQTTTAPKKPSSRPW